MARGEAIGCFALSEPDFGSDPSRMATRATKDRGGFVLNGSKMWITNGPIARVAIVWARTEAAIQGFLIEAGTPGFQVTSIQRKFSYRTSPTGLLHFKDCFVSEENLLPQALGLKPIFQCLKRCPFRGCLRRAGRCHRMLPGSQGLLHGKEGF